MDGTPISAVQERAAICNWNEVGFVFGSIGPCDQEGGPLGIRVHVTGGRSAIDEYLAVHAEIPRRGSPHGGKQQCEHSQ